MGVRIGGSIGPVSASARLTPTRREAKAMADGFGTLLWLTVLLMVLAVVVPPVIVVATVYLWRTRYRRTKALLWSATAASMLAVGFAAWAWPAYYGYAKYGTELPRTGGYDHVSEYKAELAQAGFTKIEVTRVDEPGKGPLPKTADCWVQSVSPRAGSYADTRKVVTLTAECDRVKKG